MALIELTDENTGCIDDKKCKCLGQTRVSIKSNTVCPEK